MKKKNDKWGKKQVFVVTADPYKQEVVIVLNGQFSDAIKFLKKIGGVNALENVKYVLEEQKKDKTLYIDEHILHKGNAVLYTELPWGYVMILSHSNNWIESVENVAHETMHLTHYVLRCAGLNLTKESEEAYTYLQGHVMKQILHKMY